MNYLYSPLVFYFARHAFIYYFSSIIILSFIVCLSELIEYGKLTSNIENNFLFNLKMTLLKMPLRIQDLLPYAIFFGSIISLLRLSKNSELIIARSAGLNIWLCSLPHVFIAFLIGVISVSVLSPITSVTQKKLIQIENKHLNKKNNSLQISNGGFWLYQKENEKNTAIIHAESIDPNNIELKNVIIFRYNDMHEFHERIDGESAELEIGYWKIKNGKKTDKDLNTTEFIEFHMPTNFTSSQIKESFAPPETISFWALPNFIKIIETSGFSSRKHKIYWHSILATPFLLIGMTLMGVIFAVKPLGRHGIGKRLFIATIIAFIVFFVNDVIAALGQGSNSSEIISAWAPKLAPMILSSSIILYLEDG